MNRWLDQVAVITGASAGIGAAIAEELVELGLKVVGLARRKEKLEELEKKLKNKKGKFYYFLTDISKEEDVVKAFQWIKENVGVVHILVNNAGIFRISSLMEVNGEHVQDVFNTNVFGLCIATREAIKEMKNNKVDGHIIHINSVSGQKKLNINYTNVYSASKHAVAALTETLRYELALSGSKIKVSSISPGHVQTEILEASAKCSQFTIEDFINKSGFKPGVHVPFLHSKDIADAVVYVLSTPPNVQIHELTIQPVGEQF